MSSILHIIGKGKRLFIIVEAGSEHLRNTGTDLRGTANTHQRKSPAAAAAGADVLLMLLRAGCPNRTGNQNVHHAGAAAGTFAAAVDPQFYLQAVWTDACRQHSGGNIFMRMREKHHDFFICFKILVVKRFKIDNGGVLTLVQDRDPAGDAAVTAVDNGQVLFGLLSVQIMRNFISDVLRIDLGNDAPQFPDPKLHLYIQERA